MKLGKRLRWRKVHLWHTHVPVTACVIAALAVIVRP